MDETEMHMFSHYQRIKKIRRLVKNVFFLTPHFLPSGLKSGTVLKEIF